MGCLGLSPFINGPSPPPRWSPVGLFSIFTVGFGGTYWDLMPSSPNIIILVSVLWLFLYIHARNVTYVIHILKYNCKNGTL